MQRRVIVVAVARNVRGDYLLCKMPRNRGVFPGQWGLPGGGLEDGERMNDALRREMREEVGLELTEIFPLFFKDDLRVKAFPDGHGEEVYMIHLIFEVWVRDDRVKLNQEFEEFVWVEAKDLDAYDLNVATRETFRQLGLLKET